MTYILDHAATIFVVAAMAYLFSIVYQHVTGQRLPNIVAMLGTAALVAFASYIIFVFFTEISAYEITAADLSEEFYRNEQAALSKYRGKTVSVTGVLAGSEYSSAQPWLLIGTGTRSTLAVKCMLSSAAAQKSNKPDFGEQTTVRGVFSRQNGNIILKNCSTIK